MQQNKIRVAVIGLGWVAQSRHIPALGRNLSYEIVGLIDRHEGKAETIAAKLNIKHAAQIQNTHELLSLDWFKESVDAVVIATPPMAHAELACAAMMAGKDVMVEKPFAMNVAEGERLCAVAKEQNRVLAVTHNFQFSRAAQKLERDRQTNKLGETRSIRAIQLGNPERRLPTWYDTLPLGLFYDESPHFYYLLRRFAGCDLQLDHTHIVPSSIGANTPDQVALWYKTEQGLSVSISCQFNSAISEWYLVINGTKGVGVLDIFRDIYIRLANDKTHALPHILRTSLWAIGQHIWQHIPNGWAFLRNRLDYGNDELYSRFAKAVLTRDTSTLAGFSAQDALAVLKLQHEAITASLLGA